MSYTNGLDKPSEHFNTVPYAGDSVTPTTKTGVGFQPDFVWIRNRTQPGYSALYDSVRGAGLGKALASEMTSAEGIGEDYGYVSSFASDGFGLTVGVTAYDTVNRSGSNYVAWNWLAGGAGSLNEVGSIDSTVSANTTAGFSIVSYTGTGSVATIGHGLGSVPKMILVKNRDAADAWQVYHSANTASPETDYLVLNTTAATADSATRWNDTTPTSSLFTIGTGVEVNTSSEDYIAYCFADVKGYSKFGSYIGNGNADGTFVNTGFKPAWVMIKMSSSTSNWTILDNLREGYNVDNDPLYANTSSAEGTTDLIDILSNGFKLRSSDASINTSGGTYIYMAFASSPFVTSTGIPCTAR